VRQGFQHPISVGGSAHRQRREPRRHGGHHPHKDPKHPKPRYRHRKLSTADNHGVDRLNGEVETIPAGELCDGTATDINSRICRFLS
jgi:hypothetical protein